MLRGVCASTKLGENANRDTMLTVKLVRRRRNTLLRLAHRIPTSEAHEDERNAGPLHQRGRGLCPGLDSLELIHESLPLLLQRDELRFRLWQIGTAMHTRIRFVVSDREGQHVHALT